jgi:hypothetical protein
MLLIYILQQRTYTGQNGNKTSLSLAPRNVLNIKKNLPFAYLTKHYTIKTYGWVSI